MTLLVWTSCGHSDTTYFNKYGDECCSMCHESLGWSPWQVNAGVYGDDTAAWIRSQGEARGVSPTEVEAAIAVLCL